MKRVLAMTGLMLAAAGPAHADLRVFGSAQARACYDAAQTLTTSGINTCDHALDNDQLSNRDKAATLVNRGILHNAARQLDLAIADFGAALVIDPAVGEAYLNRGNSYFYRRQFDMALADYSKSIELKVTPLAIAYYDRALVYEILKRYGDAKADLRSALEIRKNFKEASDRLTVIDKILKTTPQPAGTQTSLSGIKPAVPPAPGGASPAQ